MIINSQKIHTIVGRLLLCSNHRPQTIHNYEVKARSTNSHFKAAGQVFLFAVRVILSQYSLMTVHTHAVIDIQMMCGTKNGNASLVSSHLYVGQTRVLTPLPCRATCCVSQLAHASICAVIVSFLHLVFIIIIFMVSMLQNNSY